MRYIAALFLIMFGWADVLYVDVPAPEYSIYGDALTVDNATYKVSIGAPDVPCRTVTLAIPPGAIVDNVRFRGARNEIGTLIIQPKLPPFSLSDVQINKELNELYEKQKERYYSTNTIYPAEYGKLQSTGGLRKYSLMTVDCYHFAYNPVTQQLFYAPNITVEINYHMPAPGSDRAVFWEHLKNDITFDEIAAEKIFNHGQAQAWYHTPTPARANGFHIICQSSQTDAVNNLVSYRQNQGFDVQVVTTEHIDSTVDGTDLPQKIRNYLRANITDIQYALFVGFITNMPMRYMVPVNNSPGWYYLPTDLYYGDLTDPDSLSWNSDGDAYYGEVFNGSYDPPGDDNPDYYQDIHVGRIPVDHPAAASICSTIIAFDSNIDVSYKEAALLPASIPFYENENHGGGPLWDGAGDMEALMDAGIIDRANAVYLYETAGLSPSTYTGTDSLCRMNQIAYWNRKGIMYEYHHGNPTGYARLIWTWDDGDSVPEDPELQFALCLSLSDVSQIDNDYSSTTILRSCSCGKPTVYNITMELMAQGVSSSVISGSDLVWAIYSDRGGLPHHFLERLLVDTTITHGVIGDAFTLAKIDFMDATGWWPNGYVLTHFCDPATRHMGRLTSVETHEQITPTPLFSVYPNPTTRSVAIYVQQSIGKDIELDVFDNSGRLVQTVFTGTVEASRTLTTELPTGIYFVRYQDAKQTQFKKVVVVNK